MRILYRLFTWLYPKAVWLLSWFNPKAKRWITGRKDQFRKLAAYFYHNREQRQVVWMHCASLGEFEQGRPLLEAIRELYPDHIILLSFFSPSGYEASKHYPIANHICYLPMDRPANASRWLNIVQPSLVLFVKYEFWFYYLDEIKQRNIPLLLVSGIFRKDQPFFAWYGRFYRKMLDCFTHLFVQNEASFQLLDQIGHAHHASICGDTRFDRVMTIATQAKHLPVIEQFCGKNKVIVAGSTWTEDDEALDHFANTHPSLKWIIAPHDVSPERLKECLHLYHHSILLSEYTQLAAKDKEAIEDYRVLVIDNYGLLSSLYRYAHIAFVGGGFGDDGIHNILEAAVFGIPVVFGPVYDKYAEAVALIDLGGAISVDDALHLEKILQALLNDETYYKEAATVSGRYVAENGGATKAIIDQIQEKRLLTN